MLVRALRPDDAPGLAEAFEQLSETSRYRLFFTAKPHLSEQTLAFLTESTTTTTKLWSRRRPAPGSW